MRIDSVFYIKKTTLLLIGLYILLVMDIPYLRHLFGTNGVIYTGIEALILFLAVIVQGKSFGELSRVFLVLLVYAAWMIFSTFIGSGNIKEYVVDFFPIVVIAFVFDTFKNDAYMKNKLINSLIIYLSIIVLIDLITILLFPEGLYFGSGAFAGTNNTKHWFLGYKTNRMLYSFPMLVFYFYHIAVEKKKLGILGVIFSCLTFADMYLSGGTSGSVSLLLFVLVGFLLMTLKNRAENTYRRLASWVSRYWLFFLVYIAMVALIVFTQKNKWFIDLAVKWFSKSETLSNRTELWRCTVENLKKNYLWGYGWINALQYSQITGGYVNPHNTVLSYLLTGGIPGTAILIVFMVMSLRRVGRNEGSIFLLLGVYCVFLLGITSSTLAFSPFLFSFYTLIYDAEPANETDLRLLE